MSDSRRVDRIGTLLIADIEGSTAFRAAVGEELAQGCIDCVLRTIGDAVGAAGGQVVKAMGDGVLARFEAPGPAFDAAVRIQRAMVDSDVKVRIGVHAGQLKLAEDDVHGMAVHVADRVTHLAAGGEIVVSAMARALASPEPRWRWSDRGPQPLRGLPEPVAVYELLDARPADDANPPADVGWEPEQASASPSAPRSLTLPSLPRYRTSLVGREEQLDTLASFLQPSAIVTLTGVGGAGISGVVSRRDRARGKPGDVGRPRARTTRRVRRHRMTTGGLTRVRLMPVVLKRSPAIVGVGGTPRAEGLPEIRAHGRAAA